MDQRVTSGCSPVDPRDLVGELKVGSDGQVVAGPFFSGLPDSVWEDTEDLYLVEVRYGLLAIVRQGGSGGDSYRMWRAVKREGGSAWFRARRDWLLWQACVEPGFAEVVLHDAAERGDELVSLDRYGLTGSHSLRVLLGLLQGNEADLAELLSFGLREVGMQRAALVQNSSCSVYGYTVGGYLMHGHSDELMLCDAETLVLDHADQFSAVSLPEGLCYLELVEPAERRRVFEAVGRFPTATQLACERASLLPHVWGSLVLGDEVDGVRHVDSMAPVSSFGSVAQQEVLVGGTAEPQVVALDSQFECLKRLERYVMGKDKLVAACVTSGTYVGPTAQEVQVSRVLTADPIGITEDGYYRYQLEARVQTGRACVVLSKGVYAVFDGAIVGSAVFPTYLVVGEAVRLTLLRRSPYSAADVRAALPPGIVWSSVVQEKMRDSDSLMVTIFLDRDRLFDQFVSRIFLDWNSSEMQMARKYADVIVRPVPTGGGLIGCTSRPGEMRTVDLHDPLDDWASCYKQRVEMHVIEDPGGWMRMPTGLCHELTVLTSLRWQSQDSSKTELWLKVGSGLVVRDKHAKVACMDLGSLQCRLMGASKGDEVSWRVRCLRDAYAFDCEED